MSNFKKEKNVRKNGTLLLGSLALTTVLSVGMIVACSSNSNTIVQYKLAGTISDVASIKPNSIVDSEAYIGWDIKVVSVDSINQPTATILSEFVAGSQYRLQFILKPYYIVLSYLFELTIDPFNESIYYSDIYTFNGNVEIFDQAQVDALFVTEFAKVLGSFDGWVISVVEPSKTTNGEYVTSTGLRTGTEYKLRFTVVNYYLVDGTFSNEFLIFKNGSYYTTKTYFFIQYAGSIGMERLNNIYPNSTGVVATTIPGWSITVVDSKSENQVIINNLETDSLYYLKFTIFDIYTVPNDIGGLIFNEDDGSYYSSVRSYINYAKILDQSEAVRLTTWMNYYHSLNVADKVVVKETLEAEYYNQGWTIWIEDGVNNFAFVILDEYVIKEVSGSFLLDEYGFNPPVGTYYLR